ncbi:MAG: hypothetical protein ACM3ZO_00670 [Clostridia bacterium]
MDHDVARVAMVTRVMDAMTITDTNETETRTVMKATPLVACALGVLGAQVLSRGSSDCMERLHF